MSLTTTITTWFTHERRRSNGSLKAFISQSELFPGKLTLANCFKLPKRTALAWFCCIWRHVSSFFNLPLKALVSLCVSGCVCSSTARRRWDGASERFKIFLKEVSSASEWIRAMPSKCLFKSMNLVYVACSPPRLFPSAVILLCFCRYVGELISDAEADVREDDSYLFDLDNKVSWHWFQSILKACLLEEWHHANLLTQICTETPKLLYTVAKLYHRTALYMKLNASTHVTLFKIWLFRVFCLFYFSFHFQLVILVLYLIF